MADIVERLRYTARIRGHARAEPDLVLNECIEAADTIERLRAALKDIAKVTYGSDWTWGDDELAEYYSMRFFKAQETARAALQETK